MVTQTLTDGQSGQSGLQSNVNQRESEQTLNIDLFNTAVDQLKMLTQTLPQTNNSKSLEAHLLFPWFPNDPSPLNVTARTYEGYQSGKSYECNVGGAQPGTSHSTTLIDRLFFARDTHNDYAGETASASRYAPYDARAQERYSLLTRSTITAVYTLCVKLIIS